MSCIKQQSVCILIEKIHLTHNLNWLTFCTTQERASDKETIKAVHKSLVANLLAFIIKLVWFALTPAYHPVSWLAVNYPSALGQCGLLLFLIAILVGRRCKEMASFALEFLVLFSLARSRSPSQYRLAHKRTQLAAWTMLCVGTARKKVINLYLDSIIRTTEF